MMNAHHLTTIGLILSFLLSTVVFGAELPSGMANEGFAPYEAVTGKLPDAYRGPTIPVAKNKIENLELYSLNDAQLQLLLENGFVVTPARWKEFFTLYDEAHYYDLPLFITTDSVLHVYHLLFNKLLRDLEREYLAPDIAELTRLCREEAERLNAELSDTELADTARRVLAYFSVAENLISPDAAIPKAVEKEVKKELALIHAHRGIEESAVFGGVMEDYSQYIPRGHYTKSEYLERYFRTMMWYGRINLRLDNRDETKMALLITYIIRNTENAASLWERVYEPTAFIVGKSDDLGFTEYGRLWDEVFGRDAAPTVLTKKKQIDAFTAAARELPPPQINSMWVYIWEDKDDVTQGFRFMGSRYVLDAYIFEQLTFREVGTLDNARWLPSALDAMAVLGSDEAHAILEEMGETAYLNYPERYEKVKGEVIGLEMDSWTQNIYWAWFYTLTSLLSPKGEAYPAFMRTTAWTRKDLACALGSYTELKHDTILYAKQMMAEMGGYIEEIPHGWVEPQPEAYGRLLGLVRMTRDGLKTREMVTEEVEDSLIRLESLLTFLYDVSTKELFGEPLTQSEYERIMWYGGTLEALTLAAADKETEWSGFFEKVEAAVIADVATDPNGRVLEEAIGRVFEIYVVIPTPTGGLSIAKGGVFSYYEFAWPLSDRLTDEAWRQMLEREEIPERPAWTGSFIVE
jgi:hypothetical protein